MGRNQPLRLFGPPETRRIVETLIHQIYDEDIEFPRAQIAERRVATKWTAPTS